MEHLQCEFGVDLTIILDFTAHFSDLEILCIVAILVQIPAWLTFFFSSPFSVHFSFFQLSLSFNEDINYFQCEFGVDLIISLDFTGLGNLEVTNFQTLLLVKADQ